MNGEELSPDGSIRVPWSVSTGRMSHEIWSPKIIDVKTGGTIPDLHGEDWDGSFDWLDHGRFSVSLRRYGGGRSFTVWVDPVAGVFRSGAENAPGQRLACWILLV